MLKCKTETAVKRIHHLNLPLMPEEIENYRNSDSAKNENMLLERHVIVNEEVVVSKEEYCRGRNRMMTLIYVVIAKRAGSIMDSTLQYYQRQA